MACRRDSDAWCEADTRPHVSSFPSPHHSRDDEPHVQVEDLIRIFSVVGVVTQAAVMRTQRGAPRGTAMVEMETSSQVPSTFPLDVRVGSGAGVFQTH